MFANSRSINCNCANFSIRFDDIAGKSVNACSNYEACSRRDCDECFDSKLTQLHK